MGTTVLNDIRNDLKLLIKAITAFEENDEGFKICERFALSNIKHHRYLSVNSHGTKEIIDNIATKFSVYGKYNVAKKFRELINTFLTSFDFEHHPQYDLQWSLLTLLLDLSNETHKSDLNSLKAIQNEHSFNIIPDHENDIPEEINWVHYLKEGEENFFCDFKSDDESECFNSTDEEILDRDTLKLKGIASTENTLSEETVCYNNSLSDILTQFSTKEIESRKWLFSNIQNTWWTKLEWHKCPIYSRFVDAHLCELWQKTTHNKLHSYGTLSEYQTCRELLWMFYVQAQMVIFEQKSGSNFSICPNVTIPSLTTTAFKSILLPFCEYFSMMYEIEQFGSDLYLLSNDDALTYKKPSFTYEAYNAAMQEHLIKHKQQMVDIEKTIMKQDGCHTLLSLVALLQDPLNNIKILYEIHQITVSDWRTNPNWKCAFKLLSSLCFIMQNSHSRKKTNICANLFVSSIIAYLNIIDTWLSEGRLEDWRDEFIIVRTADKMYSENCHQYEKFTTRPLHDISLTDPIMQFLVGKLQHMGHSIELLISLDRIADMWKVNTENDDGRVSLNDKFYAAFISRISKYSFSEKEVEIHTTRSDVNGISSLVYDEDIRNSVIQQLSMIDNPFLMKAFKDYIPSDLCKKDVVDTDTCKNIPQIRQRDLFERLEKTSKYVLPLRKILENTLCEVLTSQYNSASRLVKDIMTREYKLETHLKLMRSVYMMEAGHIMNKFYQILFYEIESNQMWNNSYFLSCILEEVLSQQWPNLSSRWSVAVQYVNTHQVLEAIDNITLHYAVGWPINIILNESSLQKYNEVFRFQLKLKWALWTLNNLRFADLEGTKLSYIRNNLEHFQIRRLESLRFWLLHAIGSIHSYLSGQVLQSLGFTFDKSLTQAENLNTIILAHNEYLNKVHEHCLLTMEFEDLMSTINNLIEMCIRIRDLWDHRKLMIAITELSVMESSYIKYHTYLALALHNAVQHKDADYYKLTPSHQIEYCNNIDRENQIAINFITDLSRSLLSEIAHQSLPPSGIPIPIPKIVHKKDWITKGFNSMLLNDILLKEYEQTFSYMRWYKYEEQYIMLISSTHTLYHEMQRFIDQL